MKFIVLLPLALFGLVSCEQFNPRPDWAKYDKEKKIAHSKLPSLDAKGALIADADQVAEVFDIDQIYKNVCANCHGAGGKGDGPGGAAFGTYRGARNFTDTAWQGSVDDAHVENVIVNGAVAAGLKNANPSMAPLGAIIDTDAKRKAMVEKVRSFGKK